MCPFIFFLDLNNPSIYLLPISKINFFPRKTKQIVILFLYNLYAYLLTIDIYFILCYVILYVAQMMMLMIVYKNCDKL